MFIHLSAVVFYIMSDVLPVSVVSMMATQEYEGMKDQLDLEQNLRVKAETYAHEVTMRRRNTCCRYFFMNYFFKVK